MHSVQKDITMKTNDHNTELLEKLTEADIRPSMQRLEILEFISSCKSHPTADEIYAFVHRNNPTMSRTTVFNSVRLLAEKGLINDINIAADSTRYDSADYTPHAHFICRECKRIFDIPFDMSALTAPDDFACDNVNVYFKGICPECRKKTEQTI